MNSCYYKMKFELISKSNNVFDLFESKNIYTEEMLLFHNDKNAVIDAIIERLKKLKDENNVTNNNEF